jgi:acyl-CoA hydrolase
MLQCSKMEPIMPKSPTMLPIARPTEARVLEIVFPDHTNHLGTLFGGQALAWMDKAAFLAASRYSRKIVVTARSEQVDFHVPVRKGQMVELVATVVSVGRTSMNIDVAMFTEELITGERELCTRGTFVMIALDENHKPTLVESLAADDRA